MRTFELLWQTKNTGGGNCPALYRTRGGYSVQGKVTGTPNEVWVDADVIDRLTPDQLATIGYAVIKAPLEVWPEPGYIVTGTETVDLDDEVAQLYQLDVTSEIAVIVPARITAVV